MTPMQSTVYADDDKIKHGIQSDDDIKLSANGVTTTGQLNQSSSGESAMNKILKKIRVFVLGFLGFGVLAMLSSFTLHALELAMSSGNPNKRPVHVQALGIDFAVMAFLGALAWIAGIAYNAL